MLINRDGTGKKLLFWESRWYYYFLYHTRLAWIGSCPIIENTLDFQCCRYDIYFKRLYIDSVNLDHKVVALPIAITSNDVSFSYEHHDVRAVLYQNPVSQNSPYGKTPRKLAFNYLHLAKLISYVDLSANGSWCVQNFVERHTASVLGTTCDLHHTLPKLSELWRVELYLKVDFFSFRA
jgi:hypothetical protein